MSPARRLDQGLAGWDGSPARSDRGPHLQRLLPSAGEPSALRQHSADRSLPAPLAHTLGQSSNLIAPPERAPSLDAIARSVSGSLGQTEQIEQLSANAKKVLGQPAPGELVLGPARPSAHPVRQLSTSVPGQAPDPTSAGVSRPSPVAHAGSVPPPAYVVNNPAAAGRQRGRPPRSWPSWPSW
jgi:hypothetical protein